MPTGQSDSGNFSSETSPKWLYQVDSEDACWQRNTSGVVIPYSFLCSSWITKFIKQTRFWLDEAGVGVCEMGLQVHVCGGAHTLGVHGGEVQATLLSHSPWRWGYTYTSAARVSFSRGYQESEPRSSRLHSTLAYTLSCLSHPRLGLCVNNYINIRVS